MSLSPLDVFIFPFFEPAKKIERMLNLVSIPVRQRARSIERFAIECRK